MMKRGQMCFVIASAPWLAWSDGAHQGANRDALTLLHCDREHTCIVELLKLLEDAQCPDYMLQKELQWAYSAKFEGFDFNPRAMTSKANVQWIYKALEHSQDQLPHIVPVSLEDHDNISNVVCFDFACTSIIVHTSR
jgi:hypothetical protein